MKPSDGKLFVNAEPWFVPQIFGQYNHLTIGQALKVENKLNALQEILKGNVSEQNYSALGDDWTIEERCNEALKYWQLNNLDLSQKMATLSGGQKTKVLLAGISIHQPELVLLDEPGNHLDVAGRQLLYSFIQSTQSTLLIVSHDRKLLNLLGKVAELSKRGITIYGGNYDFYKGQKQQENNALQQDLQSKEKALRKAKGTGNFGAATKTKQPGKSQTGKSGCCPDNDEQFTKQCRKQHFKIERCSHRKNYWN